VAPQLAFSVVDAPQRFLVGDAVAGRQGRVSLRLQLRDLGLDLLLVDPDDLVVDVRLDLQNAAKSREKLLLVFPCSSSYVNAISSLRRKAFRPLRLGRPNGLRNSRGAGIWPFPRSPRAAVCARVARSRPGGSRLPKRSGARLATMRRRQKEKRT
jgi:hypothetical protein